jgi:hypothetical protein
VVEAFRHHITLGPALDRVIADLLGRIERLLEIAALEQALLRGVVAPDAGEAIGLQLDPDRHLVLLDWLIDRRMRLNSGSTPIRFCT